MLTSPKNILTIATGKELYINLALNLARSFVWWHPKTDILFYLVTDRADIIPSELRGVIKLIEVKPGELPEGFSSKLFLDKLAPEGQTIFIDSDCLIFGPLDKLFDRFKGHSVSVIGSYIRDGEWFGDISTICNRYSIDKMPKFNGGMYYIEKSPIATEVYDLARTLEQKYDEIGFKRLRNRPNDEVIMSLAMALTRQQPVIDDGTIMSDPLACPGGYYLDVIKGRRWLINPPAPHPLHQNWYPFQTVEPVVVHFLGYYTNHYPYKREVLRLTKALSGELNSIEELAIRLKIEIPERIKNGVKDLFRPLFHKIFGPRKVKISERL